MCKEQIYSTRLKYCLRVSSLKEVHTLKFHDPPYCVVLLKCYPQTFLVSLEELKKCTHHIPCSIIRVSAGRTKSSEPADHLRLKTTIPGILIPVREHNSFVRR